MTHPPLRTASLRWRVTAWVGTVLALVVILAGIVLNHIVVSEAERRLGDGLERRIELAQTLAEAGAGPQQIVNRLETDGVRAHLVLRNGTAFGTPPPSGAVTLGTTLSAPTRVDGAQLTLSVETSLVSTTQPGLRRLLLVVSLAALALGVVLVAGAVRLALKPLDAMAALTGAITKGNRGQRLAPTRKDTEIGRMAQAVDEMLDELEGAESRARQAEERTQAFLADAAHELRTPITGVQAAAETLLHHGDRIPAADREHLQALIVREAQRAGTLISHLLAAARLDAGLDLHRELVPLEGLAAPELDRIRLLHPEATVTTGGERGVAVMADRDKVSGVLRNVLDNAARAAGPQGRIRLDLDRRDGFAVVDVWDSGPGVPPSRREQIFERLVRLDHGRSADAGGSGLGLAIARGYARAHGGDLVCLDPGGPGALFRLTLPLGPPS